MLLNHMYVHSGKSEHTETEAYGPERSYFPEKTRFYFLTDMRAVIGLKKPDMYPPMKNKICLVR